MKRIILAALIPLTIGAAPPQKQTRTQREEARAAKLLEGLVPGTPQACIPQRPQASISQYQGTILYRVSRNRVYRNNVSQGCFGLGDDIVVARLYSSQYCRGDIIRTVDRMTGMNTGSCVLGDFVPYTRPGK